MHIGEIQSSKLRFRKYQKNDFFLVVKQKVDEYFKSNQLSYYAPTSTYVKGGVLTILYVTAYLALMSNSFQLMGILLLFGSIGVLKGLIGFNLIHDALHGSLSRSKTFNKLIGYWFDINGTSSFIWKIAHNIHHHIYTNIPGYDDDIDKAILLRLNTSDKVYWFHRFQHIYAPILYSLIGFNWVFYSDYYWFYKEGKNNKAKVSDVTIFFILKAANLLLFLILPLLFLTVPWWYVLLGFTSMQVCGGLVISIVFQLAHIVDNVQYFEPDEAGNLENNWAEHELKTTSNFATDSRLVTEIVGGLNFQVEHHLFPYISHAHYPKVSKIVRATAKEHGLPYNEQPTFFQAVCSHFHTLKRLGVGETTNTHSG